MKIAVIGAAGRAGRMIAFAAWKRGHEVTAILRDRDKAPGIPYPWLEKDLFDLTKEDLAGYDAVISAFGLPFGGDHPADAYQKAMEKLISLFRELRRCGCWWWAAPRASGRTKAAPPGPWS